MAFAEAMTSRACARWHVGGLAIGGGARAPWGLLVLPEALSEARRTLASGRWLARIEGGGGDGDDAKAGSRRRMRLRRWRVTRDDECTMESRRWTRASVCGRMWTLVEGLADAVGWERRVRACGVDAEVRER